MRVPISSDGKVENSKTSTIVHTSGENVKKSKTEKCKNRSHFSEIIKREILHEKIDPPETEGRPNRLKNFVFLGAGFLIRKFLIRNLSCIVFWWPFTGPRAERAAATYGFDEGEQVRQGRRRHHGGRGGPRAVNGLWMGCEWVVDGL